MRDFSLRKFTNGLISSLLVVPLAFVGSAGLVEAKGEAKQTPASPQDIFIYRAMGASYLCNARAAGVEFSKAVGIAAATYAQVLNGRHGGLVSSAGKKKLTNKQLFAGAEFQIITGALQYCSKEVPADIKKKVNEAMKKQKKLKKKK